MLLSTLKLGLKSAAIGAALLSSTSAFAQWQGTWDTKYGEVKLQQTQKHIYGDYGSWGTIEGVVSNDRRTVRGVYKRNDDGSKGYFEWKLTSTDGFTGRWANTQISLPIWNKQGTGWTGTRQSSAKPRLVVYRGNGSMGAFMAAQDGKYTRWISAMYAQSSTPSTSSPGQSTAAAPKPKAVHPLAERIPMFKAYQANFRARYFEVSLVGLGMFSTLEDVAEAYGTIGIYAYCETRIGSRPLVPFGAVKNRVFERGRGNTLSIKRVRSGANRGYERLLSMNEHTRRFPLDEQCLADPEGRIAIQIQSNLKEKDNARRFDEDFGYRAYKLYLDQIEDGVTFGANAEGLTISTLDNRPPSWQAKWRFRTSNGEGASASIRYRIRPVR